MLAQTKRWGLDSKGKGRNRNSEIYTNIIEYSALAEYSEVTPSVFALFYRVTSAPFGFF